MNSRFSALSARSVAAAAALCCASLAHAQSATPSSVTLYGLVDVGVTSVSGLKAGTVTQVASGIMEGSRWGIKGTEDLGGGYKAIFTLESRFEADTGALGNKPISGTQLSDRYSDAGKLKLDASYPGLPVPTQTILKSLTASLADSLYGINIGDYGNRLFDRQAFVGLITPVGAVLAGRIYTPAFETQGTFDIMGTQSALGAGQLITFPSFLEIRQSNSLAYRAEKSGFAGMLMASLGDRGEEAGNHSRTLGFNASYKSNGLAVGLGHNAARNELGQDSLATTVLGASMTNGTHTVSSMVVKIKDDNPANMGIIGLKLAPFGASFAAAIQDAYTQALKQDGTLFHIGYRYVTGPNSISVAFNTHNDKTAANADVRSYGVAYTYALSKRTDLNAVLVRYDNKNLSQVAPGGNGYIGGVTASAATDSTGLALGVRHRF